MILPRTATVAGLKLVFAHHYGPCQAASCGNRILLCSGSARTMVWVRFFARGKAGLAVKVNMQALDFPALDLLPEPSAESSWWRRYDLVKQAQKGLGHTLFVCQRHAGTPSTCRRSFCDSVFGATSHVVAFDVRPIITGCDPSWNSLDLCSLMRGFGVFGNASGLSLQNPCKQTSPTIP